MLIHIPELIIRHNQLHVVLLLRIYLFNHIDYL